MSHNPLIDALGGTAAVAKITGGAVTGQAVSLWRRRGIPWRWRARIAEAALYRGVAIPPDFLTDQSLRKDSPREGSAALEAAK